MKRFHQKRRRQFVRPDDIPLTDKQLISAVLDEKCKHISRFIDRLMEPKPDINLLFEQTPIVKSPTYAWRLVKPTKDAPFTEGEIPNMDHYRWVIKRIT